MTGRVVLATGASRNLGLAVARRFADDGDHVVINGVVPGEAEEAARTIGGPGGSVAWFDADVSDPDQVGAMADFIRGRFGRLDVLVNNAALTMVGRVPLTRITVDDWDRIFAVNARGTFLCTLAAVPLMASGSAIVNISSIGATKAHRLAAAYDATKGAVEAFTRAAAIELASSGIRVNAVAPGAIANALFARLPEATQLHEAEPIPAARIGSPEDVAAAVFYLASDDASYVTGHVLTVDGGLTAQARQESAEVDIEGRGSDA